MTDFAWLGAPDRAAVRGLLDAVAAVDGRPSLPDDGSLPREFRGGGSLLATDGAELVGLAHLNTDGDALGRAVAEVLVRPDARRRGVGGELVRRLLDRFGDGDGTGDSLRLWAHGDQPGAARLAETFGFHRVRELRRLTLAFGAPLPEPRLPDGVRLRSFVRGADEVAVVGTNRLAFAWHPEQGGMTPDDLRDAETESWFDPEGLLLAEDAWGGLVGFHWTKVHTGVPGPDGVDTGPIGEVYVVAVHPDAQGGGLGKALALAGLHYLRDERGLGRVMLYVESDNEVGLALYAKLGFTEWDQDVQYAR